MTTPSARSLRVGPTYPTIPHMRASLICPGIAGRMACPDRPPCTMSPMASTADGLTSPYVELSRDDWAALRNQHPMLLSQEDVVRLRGLGERLDIQEIEEVYLPLSRLLSFYEQETDRLHQVTSDFLGERRARTPFVIGVAGSVAVGKSTTARILQALIERWESK